MRVTNGMIASQTLRNIEASLRRLDRHNQQLSTGKRINLPSDDPSGTEISMRIQSSLLEHEKYIANVEDGISWLNATDSALNQVTEILQRARTLAVQGASGSLSDDSFRALAMEADQLLGDLVEVGNLKHGHKFVFSGENTLTAPFEALYDVNGTTITGVVYYGTTGDYSVEPDPTARGSLGLSQEVGPGIRIRIGTHGDVALLPAIDALLHLRDNLLSRNVDAIGTEDLSDPADTRSTLDRLDGAIDNVLVWRSESGARVNRLELVRGRLEETHTNLTRLLSERTDVDVAGTIMDLKMEENVYRLALASGARIIQPTLLDFLR